MNVYSLDLNLIKSLEALLSEQNVSHAAKKVGITQPAMSNALKRLRFHFKDPILAKTRNGMKATRLGAKLCPDSKRILDQMEELFFRQEAFDPKKTTHTFNIAASNYTSFIYGPPLIRDLARNFPNLKVNLFHLKSGYSIEDLESGDADLVFLAGVEGKQPPSLYKRKINDDEFFVAAWRGNRLVNKKMTLEKYLKLSHIVVHPEGLNSRQIEEKLAKKGHVRNKVAELPHFSVALSALIGSQHLLTLPRKVLLENSLNLPIEIYKLPFKLPKIEVSLLWHELAHKDAAVVWLRNHIYKLFLNEQAFVCNAEYCKLD